MNQERLQTLRAVLSEARIDAYIVGSADPHQSEYVAPRYASRAWLSGFSGSAGTLVVTQKHAALWTDSRYWLEAQTVLDGTGITLMREGAPDTPSIAAWLDGQLGGGTLASFDAQCMCIKEYQELKRQLELKHIRLEPGKDYLDELWTDRPGLPLQAVHPFVGPFVVEERREKLERLSSWLNDQGYQWFLISALDEIAWLFNLRGTDVEYNPVFYAYAICGPRGNALFVDEQVLNQEIIDALRTEGVIISPYHSLAAWVQTLSSEDRLLIPERSTSAAWLKATSHMRTSFADSPLALWKAKKTEAELKSLRSCMEKDGVAMVKFLSWLETALADKSKSYSEADLAKRLIEFRAEGEGFIEESFPAIIGYAANGAIVHYRPDPKTSAKVIGRGLLLIDSGAQYTDGTTDITRVAVLGKPNELEKEMYTRVLKGHIRLARAKFPRGTNGTQLDILARMDLWAVGKNYGHGTGHGVGFCLNVHEGPQRISPAPSTVALDVGMVISNEPGYYQTGAFGVRIENLIAVSEPEQEGGFLSFETLTLCPFEPELIDVALLDRDEIDWINAYHDRVNKLISKRVGRDVAAWLKKKTRQLGD